MKYKSSQIGWLALAIFLPIILLLYFAYAFQWGNNFLSLTPFLIISGLLVIICSMFYKLTVNLESSTLKLIYGIGLIRIKFKIEELRSTEIIKTPWYYGLGIRITPKGMLYNIQGTKAVRIEYNTDGINRSIMVGTSEPEQLVRALNENFNS